MDEPLQEAPALASEQKTILVVDDDPQILECVIGFLNKTGWNLITAKNGTEGLQKSIDYLPPIHLLLSDFQMPGLSGVELAIQMTAHRPLLKVLLMSGFTDGMLVLNEGWYFLAKPFVASQLSAGHRPRFAGHKVQIPQLSFRLISPPDFRATDNWSAKSQSTFPGPDAAAVTLIFRAGAPGRAVRNITLLVIAPDILRDFLANRHHLTRRLRRKRFPAADARNPFQHTRLPVRIVRVEQANRVDGGMRLDDHTHDLLEVVNPAPVIAAIGNQHQRFLVATLQFQSAVAQRFRDGVGATRHPALQCQSQAPSAADQSGP